MGKFSKNVTVILKTYFKISRKCEYIVYIYFEITKCIQIHFLSSDGLFIIHRIIVLQYKSLEQHIQLCQLKLMWHFDETYKNAPYNTIKGRSLLNLCLHVSVNFYNSHSKHCWTNMQLKLKRTIRNDGVGNYMPGK